MKTIEKVMHMLHKDPRTRDNDNLLIARIWFDEMSHQQLQQSTFSFLVDYANSRITSAESIKRCRQKLQQEYPGLRGKSYTARHNVKYENIFK